MATTVSWSISKHHKKSDGTYNAKIRIIHNRKIAYMPTNIYTPNVRFKKGAVYGIITDGDIEDSLNDKVKNIRKIINDNINIIDQLETAKEVVCYVLKIQNRNNQEIDFINFARSVIENNPNNGNKRFFTTAINSLCHFLESEKIKVFTINNLTSKFLRKYEAWLRIKRNVIIKNKKTTLLPVSNTGINNYITVIRLIFNRAKIHYNDYELNDIVIKHDPFMIYKIPKPDVPVKKDITKQIIQKIYNYKKVDGIYSKRDEEAADVFMLSFMLAGINLIDLYTCTKLNNNRIEYCRQKTKNRKKDKSFISIPIVDEAIPLFEKYKDKTGKRVFNFYQKHTSSLAFNNAICFGMKRLCKNLDIEKLKFYDARHAFASIARNKCNFTMDDIAFCLTHSSSHAITEIYITPDYNIIDKVVNSVVKYALYEQKVIDL